jgi:hypothetical protein
MIFPHLVFIHANKSGRFKYDDRKWAFREVKMTTSRKAVGICIAAIMVISALAAMCAPVSAEQQNGLNTSTSISYSKGNLQAASISNPVDLRCARILFDESHNEHNYLDDDDPNNQSDAWSLTTWRDTLVSNGATVDKLQTGPIDTTALNGYNVFVISCPRVALSLAEIDAIETFVSEGGGLLLISEADHYGYDSYGTDAPANIDAISDVFDISIDFTVTGGPSSQILTHEITSGVNTVMWRYGTTVTPSGSAFALIRTADNADDFMAANEYGAGRVVVIGDTNIWDDPDNANGMNTADNGQLAVNTIAWLGPCAPAPTLTPIGLVALVGLLSTIAAVTIVRKRR